MDKPVLWFATRHGKERVIGETARKELGWKVLAVPGLDTDIWGTFSGETERPAGQEETARLKLQAAAAKGEGDLWISSEGAFFPDPLFPFSTRNTELLLFQDRKIGIELVASYTETGFPLWEKTVYSEADLRPGLHRRDYHAEGLILKAGAHGNWQVRKDFYDAEAVLKAFKELKATGLEIRLQPDLRAHRNQRRRENIERAFKNLIHRLKTPCPACGIPGFTAEEGVPGLPCGNCTLPTRMPLLFQTTCGECGYTCSRQPESMWADPGFCDGCNP
jgi:hypothetical protein